MVVSWPLRRFNTQQATWQQEWTRACAIYCVGRLKLSDLADIVKQAQTGQESAASETAAWALEMLTGAQQTQGHLHNGELSFS